MNRTVILVLVAMALLQPLKAGAVLFDFDNAQQYAPLPISLTVGGITAVLTATGQGYSIQAANTMGFAPQGFSGLCVYPSSVYLADLMVSYSVPLTDFSIMYAPEEYGCDSSARMRVTAYMDGAYVGTATTTAPNPGTWPTGVLSFSSSQPFNYVVIHYDAPPPTGGDWGPIFMADNMNVTPANIASVGGGSAAAPASDAGVAPNPFRSQTTIRFTVTRGGPAAVGVYDAQGRLVRTLLSAPAVEPGARSVVWDGRNDRGERVESGVYFSRVYADSRTTISRMVLLEAR